MLNYCFLIFINKALQSLLNLMLAFYFNFDSHNNNNQTDELNSAKNILDLTFLYLSKKKINIFFYKTEYAKISE